MIVKKGREKQQQSGHKRNLAMEQRELKQLKQAQMRFEGLSLMHAAQQKKGKHT